MPHLDSFHPLPHADELSRERRGRPRDKADFVWAAALVAGTTPPVDPDAFRLVRFSDGSPLRIEVGCSREPGVRLAAADPGPLVEGPPALDAGVHGAKIRL